mgnify:CR=1 FL=1
MKKVTITFLAASLLAGALYANADHMGNHKHEGKMTNHANPSGMTDSKMENMKEMHKECIAFMDSNTKKVEQKVSPETQKRIDSLYQGSDTAGMYRG